VLFAIAAGCIGLWATTASAQAAIPATLHDAPACATKDAADGETSTDIELGYVFCDDGIPSLDPAPGPGGTLPNPDGAKAITVPARYDDGATTFAGLPLKAGDAGLMAGADALGNVALDVDISLPITPPPAGGYPMIVLMHGCCGGNKTGWEANTIDAGGERWHYNNAWFAARGYVVVTYSARGFVSGGPVPGQPYLAGSTGETQLNSRSFEINDYQALACNVLAEAEVESFDDVSPATEIVGNDVIIDPDKVVTTGGSYGGGFSWLALTDPEWTCNDDTGADGTDMSLAATAPKYGWTDLAYTLVPNGTHSQLPSDLPATDGCDSGGRDLLGADCPGPPLTGVPKSSIVSALFLSGNATFTDHTTFPPEITESFACLQGTYPLESSPACDTTLSTYLPRFLRERSAYYQNDFFGKIDDGGLGFDPDYVTPVFNAGTLTDPLFPMYENRRMANRLLAVNSGYPIQQYYGDYQHFVQNKAKEWGDLCDADHHVCTLADFGGNLNADPATLVPGIGNGVTTRLNRFIDHYAAPAGNPAQPAPAFDVTSSLQVCPDNAAGLLVPADEPGPRETEVSFEALASNSLTVEMAGAQTTTSTVAGNTHAATSDPIANSAFNGGRCPRETSVAGPGVASYTTTDALAGPATMIGATDVTARFQTPITGSTDGLQLDARLYDVLPDGSTSLMVDRGPRRVTGDEAAAGEVTWELHGNGWRFQPGHRIRIELTQDDQAFLKSTTFASSVALTGADLVIPTQEAFGTDITGTPDPKPTTPSTGGGQPTTGSTAPKKCKKGFKLKKGKCKKKKKKKKK